jgi:hypothetical protein
VEPFDYKCEASLKITRFFEDIFREMEVLLRNLRLFFNTLILFEDIFNVIEAFLNYFQKMEIYLINSGHFERF